VADTSETTGLSTSVNTTNSLDYVVTGGTPKSQTNLYHSFSSFNIPTGGSVTFQGGSCNTCSAIYGRVVNASTHSTINGPIYFSGFNQTPALYLMNPFGFVLGSGFSSVNSAKIFFAAVDGVLLGNGRGGCLTGSCEYWNYAGGSSDLPSFHAFNGTYISGSLNSKYFIVVQASNLVASDLSFSAARVDFQAESAINVQSLNIYSQWFSAVGANYGLVSGAEGFPSKISLGSVSLGSANSATFTQRNSVVVTGQPSSSHFLLTRESLYRPTTTSTLVAGEVRFGGAVNSQATNVIAQKAFVSTRSTSQGTTSPWGPYATVSSAAQPISYEGIYYGFSSVIYIDPVLVPIYSSTVASPVANTVQSQQTSTNLLISLNTAQTSQAAGQTQQVTVVASEVNVDSTKPDQAPAESTSSNKKTSKQKASQESGDASAKTDVAKESSSGSEQGVANQASSNGDASAAPTPPPTTSVPPQEVAANFSSSEQNSVQQTAASLGLPSARPLTPEQAQGALLQALSAVRDSPSGGGRAPAGGGVAPPRPQRPGAGSGGGEGRGGDGDFGPRSQSLLDDPNLIAADAGSRALGWMPPVFNRAAYNPAILQVRFTEAKGRTTSADSDAFLDITFIPAVGEIVGKRVEISIGEFSTLLRQLYQQLSRQEDLRVANPASPSRRLYDLLIAPLAVELESKRVTTVLIGAERGLQGVPYAALHSGKAFLGERFAFSLTPSLSLTNLTPAASGESRLLAAGASQFDGLAPLPLVPQELDAIAATQPSDALLNAAFTPATIEKTAADPRYSRIHLATHAEFLPGGANKSKLYSGIGPVSLVSLANLRKQRQGVPIDLIAFSACRTALGDPDSELGFAGLALQAGARSAIGTLWYVDDVATSAYFIQTYRYLQQGIPKAEALQFTRRDFASGRVKLSGDQILGGDGQVLLTGLTTAQQRRVADGLSNPYFWAGIELLGSPW